MTGVSLRVNRQDFDQADRVLANAISGDTGVLMASLAEYVLSETLMNFQQERSPDGSAWEKSERAKSEGGRTLQDTRRLRNSYTYEASELQAEIGTNVIYAAIHHHGGRAGRKYAVNLPARPALGVTAQMQGEMNQMYTDWMGGLFDG
jgi:phage virion morphogenesis protein